MKKKFLLFVIPFLLLVGCTMANTPTSKVEDLFRMNNQKIENFEMDDSLGLKEGLINWIFKYDKWIRITDCRNDAFPLVYVRPHTLTSIFSFSSTFIGVHVFIISFILFLSAPLAKLISNFEFRIPILQNRPRDFIYHCTLSLKLHHRQCRTAGNRSGQHDNQRFFSWSHNSDAGRI